MIHKINETIRADFICQHGQLLLGFRKKFKNGRFKAQVAQHTRGIAQLKANFRTQIRLFQKTLNLNSVDTWRP